ncbi:hypothetical protein [Actinomyces succiniciruminis]|uniref:Helicase, superfamily 1/2, ATP-binding domain n=1 Tax=Actinomyces succiniciruminis TaxID=1522002 RepID=A0A1L7RAU5_9ACTO|nr:hypothetical protein [Actinomyces succiniciruminis]CED90975.1 Helicase, superfamily 1/2, ATP-binding domain [Actinomyces succiniciruminis]
MSAADTAHSNRYWNHNAAFHNELVADAARRGGRALDVGCGEGLLMERLAAVCDVGVPTAPARESLQEIRAASARILPGSRMRRRFYWRYSPVWDRPMGAGQ